MSFCCDYFDGFVPVKFCDDCVVELINTLHGLGYTGAKMSEDGARLPVTDRGDRDAPAVAHYFGIPSAPDWCHELVRELVRENKISLVFNSHYDSGGGYGGEEGPVDWEYTLRACPTLILREVLAQRLESSNQSD